MEKNITIINNTELLAKLYLGSLELDSKLVIDQS